VTLLAQAAKEGLARVIDLLLSNDFQLYGYQMPLPLWAAMLLLAASFLLLISVLRFVIRNRLRRATPATAERLLHVVEKLLPLWVALAVLYFALLGFGVRSDPWVEDYLRPAGYLVWMASLFWAAGSLVFLLLARRAEMNPSFQAVHAPVRLLVKIALVSVALALGLRYFGVDITPLLATGALGGVAVAFALKDTLENFFAGLHLMADRPIGEGDTIVLHDINERGTVLGVGWRSTRILTLDNNVLVVPNTKIATGALTNLTHSDPRVILRLPVGVAYGSDVERVAAALEAAVKELMGKVDGIDELSAPQALLHPGFGASSLDFTLRISISEFVHTLTAQDAIRRAILRHFTANGIEIPFPVRRVILERASKETTTEIAPEVDPAPDPNRIREQEAPTEIIPDPDQPIGVEDASTVLAEDPQPPA
jgi:small-conductance mechanosensitive channel